MENKEQQIKKFEPKFKTKNNEVNKEYNELIETLEYQPLQEFIDEVLIDNKVCEGKLYDAINIAKLSKFILINERMTNEYAVTSMEMVVIAASLLHNVFYSYGDKNLSQLFLLREKYNSLISQEVAQFFDLICQSVEGQLGKDTPIPQLIPISGNITYYFALACALYYKNQLGRKVLCSR